MRGSIGSDLWQLFLKSRLVGSLIQGENLL